MKRATTPDIGPAKRAKLEVQHSTSVFFDQVPKQCPTDIMRDGVEEDKWITGKFKMVWPPTNGRIETLASAHSSTSPNGLVFSIFFELDKKSLARLEISPMHEFRLSLRGAEVKAARKAHLSTLPIQLVFSQGVHIMWKSQTVNQEIRTLNTWSAGKSQSKVDNTWYNSEEEVLEEVHIALSSKNIDAVEPVEVSRVAPEILVSDITKQSKKNQRMEAKRQKKEARANTTISTHVHKEADPSSTLVKLSNVVRDEESNSTMAKLSSSPPANEHRATIQSDLRDKSSPNSSKSFSNNKPHLQGLPGLHISRYQPLSDIRLGQFAQLSGIVVGVSDCVKKTSRDEWMCFVQIADPSSSRSDASGQWKGLKINCFTKRYKEWLPFLRRGDAVILRDVKIDQYQNNLAGVGHSNRLRWAAYSPSAGEIYYGPPNNAPKHEKLADGFGAEFSPFYEPDSVDIQHLVSLSDWWRKLAEKDKQDSVVPNQKVQIERLHRLISETGPFVQPNGYFDCTVEILKVFLGSQGIHSLFVTDYTLSPGSSHSSKSWPSSLNESVLQMEMFDDAARLAETLMKPGEYYTIKNARMRINKAGHLEAKVQQGKITQLEESDAKNDIHLRALLRRKKDWEFKEINIDLDAFQLIQDAEEAKFFDCMVELLHIVLIPNRMPCLYVTDYSGASRLSVTGLNEPWSHGLDRRVIQIMLSDEQKHVVESAVVGTFWSVRKLRLKYNEVEACCCGILGGGEKLIVPLNVNRTDNKRLNDLLKRKEVWGKNRQKPQQLVVTLNTELPPSHSGPEIQNKQGDAYTRIRDMPLQNLDTARYQLIAKVVDFYPLELKDAFYQHCSSCKKEIPSNHKACVVCSDFDYEYVRYFYQMFILVEDQAGDQIRVSISDKCPLLAGLKRTHLGDNNAALKEFVGRVKPLVGDLVAIHDGLKVGEIVQVDTPLLCFEIDTWIIPEATRAFSLATYEAELDR